MKTCKQFSRFLFIIVLFFQFFSATALEVPPLKEPVNDHAQLFTQQELQELNSYLYAIDQNSDLQIAVLTIASLEGENLEDYAIRVAEQWQIGKKGKDSGVLLLIAAEERKLRIEVGYGLEGLITDAQANRIIRSVIAPEFKKQQYGTGVLLGVKNIAGLALKDESLISEAMKPQQADEDSLPPLPALLFFLIIYLFGVRFMPGKLFWPLLFILSSSSSHKSNGRYSSGSGFSGGSSFSGGGGRFGGGGASGSW